MATTQLPAGRWTVLLASTSAQQTAIVTAQNSAPFRVLSSAALPADDASGLVVDENESPTVVVAANQSLYAKPMGRASAASVVVTLPKLQAVSITQAAYDALGVKDPSTLYVIPTA